MDLGETLFDKKRLLNILFFFQKFFLPTLVSDGPSLPLHAKTSRELSIFFVKIVSVKRLFMFGGSSEGHFLGCATMKY